MTGARHRRYDEYLVAIEEMIRQTDGGPTPWIIVEARNQRWARVKVFEQLRDRLEHGLERFEKQESQGN